MKRASYRAAIRWIALNDSAADDDALEPTKVAELVSSVLVADIFDVTTEKVGIDVVKVRKASKWEIVGRYNGETEVIDEADTAAEANYLAMEYQLAYGSEWKVWKRRARGETHASR